ncbi:MAG: hypothetical protein R6W89_06530 [Candidatus Hydrogenedentota bacterium]
MELDPTERQRKERLFGALFFGGLLAFSALLHALGHVAPAEEPSGRSAVVESASETESGQVPE